MALLALSSLLLFCNMIRMLLPFRTLGPLVITIWRMSVGDTTRFLLVYVLALLGFSLAICVLSLANTSPDEKAAEDPLKAILSLLFVSLGDNVGGFILDFYPEARLPALNLIVYILWVVFSLILLLNLIIAMMGTSLPPAW